MDIKHQQYAFLNDLVLDFETDSDVGFTSEEINKLTNKFASIDMNKFRDSMMCHTCLMVRGVARFYHCDVAAALRHAFYNKEKGEYEYQVIR